MGLEQPVQVNVFGKGSTVVERTNMKMFPCHAKQAECNTKRTTEGTTVFILHLRETKTKSSTRNFVGSSARRCRLAQVLTELDIAISSSTMRAASF
jgi:hypothetical protein